MGKVYYQFYFYELTSFSNSILCKTVDIHHLFHQKINVTENKRSKKTVRHRDPGTKLHDIVTRDYHVLHLDYVA